MPAYRSSDEAEIRDAVTARLRRMRPNARIIHEINAAGQGSNRIDVMAVDRAEIISVEIKSKKDKLDRLNDQVKAMWGASHHVIAALHRKFMPPVDDLSMPWPAGLPEYHDMDGGYGWRKTLIWWHPSAQDMAEANHRAFEWAVPDLRNSLQKPLPPAALGLLWAEELGELCRATGVSVPARANMGQMAAALRWGATGAQITKGICAALRARQCIEADPPIRADNDNTPQKEKSA